MPAPKKVIYVSWMSLSAKVSRDWFIDYLIEKGVAVEYWDVTRLLLGQRRVGSQNAHFLRTPRSYREVQTMLRLSQNRDACYVILISYGGNSARLYRLLSKHARRLLYIDWGHHPVANNRRRRLLSHPLRLARGVLDRVQGAAYRMMKLVRPFDIVFAAGETSLASRHYAAKVIPANLCDYDNFQMIKANETRLVKQRYAVFLDINLPYQFDVAASGLKFVSAESYFRSLNRFFDLLEKQYGMTVVIAGHPTADYRTEAFQERQIYTGFTPDLVRDAELVVSHHSTAYCYAVLAYKPILFIYTDEMQRLYGHSVVANISDIANYLDASLLNVDEIARGDQIVIRNVNRDRYDIYKYSYLTTYSSEYSTTREIFWREIARE